jgi:hypothetical protein
MWSFTLFSSSSIYYPFSFSKLSIISLLCLYSFFRLPLHDLLANCCVFCTTKPHCLMSVQWCDMFEGDIRHCNINIPDTTNFQYTYHYKFVIPMRIKIAQREDRLIHVRVQNYFTTGGSSHISSTLEPYQYISGPLVSDINMKITVSSAAKFLRYASPNAWVVHAWIRLFGIITFNETEDGSCSVISF